MPFTHRFSTHRSIGFAAALALAPAGFGAVASSVVGELDLPTIATDAEHRPLAEWAAGRFDLAGLDLPIDTAIVFHDTDEPCDGADGTVRTERGREIWICVGDDEPAHQEHVVLHELAHIWTDDALEEEARERFLSLRRADNWNDRDADWWDRGTEQAAEVLVWGLLDRDPGFQRIHDRDCPMMLAGYQILTGAAPVNDDVECPVVDLGAR